jgi:HK97 family phage major capsid protein
MSAKHDVLGSHGDIGLYDFSYYVVGLRKDMSLERSAHAGFASETTYYRGLLRVDGRSTWRQAAAQR